MSYRPKCENCKFSEIQYTVTDEGYVDMHMDKPLFCSIKKCEVADNDMCEEWEVDCESEGVE